MSEEKNKPPTDKKLQDAHKDGESSKSQDLTAATTLLACVLMLWMGGGFFFERLQQLMDIVWQSVRSDGLGKGTDAIAVPIMAMGVEFLVLTLPFGLAGALGAVIGLVAQGAMTLSPKPVTPNFDKVNPASGFKRLFGMRAMIDAAMVLVKLTLFSVVLWQIVSALVPLLVGATARPVDLLSAILWQATLRVLFVSIVAFVIVGMLDYALQRFLFIRDHRMSEDEIKREQKEQNGNPEIKSRRKEFAQELLFGDPKAAVASANLVVANPTHYVVALVYERGDVPRVVAKGVDDVALALRAHAEASGVPVVVNPPLARTLHRLPLGAGIPRECFQAVGVLLHTIGGLRRISAPQAAS
ncbi:MAG: flagellar type III secretion system protein FlhB [Burkholderiaceae bacterium]|nr:flagellar type III secretion system protein FlhB [Burkholderiaceae bacterium]